ncbi:MAG: hypothetical protein PHW66_06440 [Gallionella sp.]|nr:hypothetical protein [Gallionella sp.]
MNIRNLQRSFTGGEVSPEMLGRIDDAKYQSGLALCRNFVTKPQGPAENRAGFKYVNAVKTPANKVRLIPFTFSTTQTMVLEMGAGYFRFHTQGGTLLNPGTGLPYELANTYAQADLFDIHYVQSADVLTLTHPNYPPKELRRLGATNWTLTTVAFTPSITAPTGQTATANAADATYTYSYVVTAVAADGFTESAPSAVATCTNNLFTTGRWNTIAWGAVAGAIRYNIYKQQGGLYGYIGQTTALSIKDENIAPDLGKTPPTYETVFASAGNYPSAVSYFEQRRVFAGTINQPQNIWMTRSGTESAMSYSLPIRDDDRIAFRVAAREANTIRHVVPLTQLLLLTSSAEWRVSPINSDAITPTTISVRPQSYVGASNVQPVIINNNVIYVAARGGHMRELAYSWQANGFITGDISLRAPHLFDGMDIVDMAYAKAPMPVVWAVRNDGKLLGLTYVPEQQIGAWHWHDTDGLFESCCVVAEGNEDVLYVAVQRTINGVVTRYIERIASRRFAAAEDAFFVDSGLTYDGTNTAATTVTLSGGVTWAAGEPLTLTASAVLFAFPATTDIGDAIRITDVNSVIYTCTITACASTTGVTVECDKDIPAALQGVATVAWSFARNVISGLGHLEGKTVSILADGAVHPQRIVTAGSITLDQEAVKVQIGLPITADLQTLPVAAQIDGSFGQGRFKNVNKMWLRVYRSSGIFVGPNADYLTEAKQRTTEPYGAPPALKSEEIPMVLTPSWADSGQVFVRQADPLPLTVVSMTAEVALGS